MKKGAGKSKGAAFERLICCRLSGWVSAGKRDDLFWRSAMSGGRATIGSNRKVPTLRKTQSGDITAIGAEGHELTDRYYIECKFYSSLDIEAMLIKRCGKLWKFWIETRHQARAYKKRPMLIAKQNRTPTLVLTNTGALACFPLVTVPNVCDVTDFDSMLMTSYKIGDTL